MSTATFKGYKDGTPSAGVATRYGAERKFLELPLNQPVEVEKEALAAAKELAETRELDAEGKPTGDPIYDIEVQTGAASGSASGSTGSAA